MTASETKTWTPWNDWRAAKVTPFDSFDSYMSDADKLKQTEMGEICGKDFSKYAFYPITHQKLDDYYQKQKGMFWTPQEINIRDDRYDWDKLDLNTRRFLKFILCFFAQADGIINENLIKRFRNDTEHIKEAQAFYSMQGAIETVHNEMYSIMIETLIRDPKEKDETFNAIQHFPAIRKIADWMFEWMDPSRPLLERVIAFANIEWNVFMPAFAGIYHVKRRNVLKGLCKANEFIARDEALHAEFAVALYHTLTQTLKTEKRLSQERVHDIIRASVNMSESFVREALNIDLVGLNGDDMMKYVKCTANRLCESLGYDKAYPNVNNPFMWMAIIGLPNMSNFFETKVSEYAKHGKSDLTFTIDAEF